MYYFKIEGKDRSHYERTLLVKMDTEHKPSVCDVIKYVAEKCSEFENFSHMSGPEEIQADEFTALIDREDETIFVKTENMVNPVSDDRALICDGDNDYTMKPDAKTVWIAVDNASIYIVREETGVRVSAMPLNRESEGEIEVGFVSYDAIDKLKEEN